VNRKLPLENTLQVINLMCVVRVYCLLYTDCMDPGALEEIRGKLPSLQNSRTMGLTYHILCENSAVNLHHLITSAEEVMFSPVSFCLSVCKQVDWLGFNGTFSTNRPYRAIKKIKVC